MKIAFVTSRTNRTPYSEFIPLGEFLRSRGDTPFFLIPEGSSSAIKNDLVASDILFYEGCKSNVRKSCSPKSQSQIKKNSRKFVQALKNILPIGIKQLVLFFTELYKNKYLSSVVEKVFRAEDPDVLVVYGDRTLDLTQPAIKFMRKRNKVVCDLQISDTPLWFLYFSIRKNNRLYSVDTPMNKAVSWLWPQQARKFGAETVLFYPWYVVLALAFYKMLPKEPWLTGESWANKYLMLSRGALNSHKQSGAKCNNAIVVGQFSHDTLYKSFENRGRQRRELLEKYFKTEFSSERGKRLIIMAVPQFFEHNLMSEEEAHKEIRYIISCLMSLSGISVLLSLHPKMESIQYEYLELIFPNVKLACTERLSEILPAGDMLVSVFSSVLTWAGMCAVPSLHLEYYGFGESTSSVPGCRVVRRRSDLSSEAKEVVKAGGSTKNLGLLPPFDGQSGERIFAAIHNSDNYL